ACFLGMSVGCLAASRRRDFLEAVIPLTFLSVSLSLGFLWAYGRFEQLTIDLGAQQSPQEIFFGTEKRAVDPRHFVIPLEAIAGLFFALIALTFVGLGQAMGRAFDAIPDRVRAYTINVTGSMVGIAAFGAASYLRTGPLVWFAVSLGLCLVLLRRRSIVQLL